MESRKEISILKVENLKVKPTFELLIGLQRAEVRCSVCKEYENEIKYTKV